jgi:tRNA nucleotidyltransferase/poly(A) polymerase
MASPARDKHGKLTKGGRKNLESYIEYSSPMSQILWDDWCEIVENKFLYAGKFSKEEKARDEHKVIATKKGDNIKYQTSYTPNKRTKDRLEKYTNERLKGSKIDGRNVSRDHRTIFNDIEPFIRKEAVEQIIESVGGYIPSMMTKQQRQVIVDSIKNKTLSRKDTIQALTKINPSDMMAITEKLDTNTLKYLAGMTDKSRTETLSFLRRGINKIKDNMHSSTNKSPMTDDVMIRKPVDITARKVVVDPYTESFNHQYKMLMKEYVEDFDQKWDKAVSESEELQVALDLMKNIKKKLKGEIYIVGGVPRDLLMGNAIDDVDLATNIPVEQLEKHFELRNISKNDSQPVYAILWKGYVYDLAKFRTDSGDIGRQANVSTETDSFQADTERRDLTINSFGLDENGKIVDYQGGLDDLKNKIVRAVGDAKKRFMEDATRILRVFRFAAKMDFEIEDDTKKAAIELKYLLQDPKAISKESISKEFYKSAKTGRTLANFLKKLQDTKILHDILPEFTEMEGFDHDPQHHPEGDSQVLGHIYECLNASPYKDPIINLAVLFHDFGKATTRGKKDNGFSSYHGHEAAGVPIVEGIFERLRFNELSQQDKKNILAAVDKHMLVHNLDKLNIKTLTRLIQNPAWETIKAVGYCDEASRGSGLFDEKEFWDKVKRAEEKVSNIGGSEDETRKRLKQYFSGNKLMEWFPVLIKDKSKFKDITAALQEYTLEELNAGREPDDSEMKTIVAGILKKNQFNEWYNYYQKN